MNLLLIFFVHENKSKMEKALENLDKTKGNEYPLIIGGEKIYTEDKIKSINPCNYNDVIGFSSKGNIQLAEKAMEEALKAFENWRKVPARERASYLFKAAAIMRRRKFEFSALLIEEAGKNWVEADADVAEAIDFLEYYGRQMIKYDEGMNVGSIFGEINECYYIPWVLV